MIPGWRGDRGGSWGFDEITLRSSYREGNRPSTGGSDIGFRIVLVPEPAALALMAVGASLLLRRARRLR